MAGYTQIFKMHPCQRRRLQDMKRIAGKQHMINMAIMLGKAPPAFQMTSPARSLLVHMHTPVKRQSTPGWTLNRRQ